ncbi:hypothetical protein [Acinetobacter seifertii]|uniref:hypothetical protein n=1 Tax=Acinetobacter seifertii TaxID=1530123 RepID=UPI003F5286B3
MKFETINSLINDTTHEWIRSPLDEIFYHPEDIYLSIEYGEQTLVNDEDFAFEGIMVSIRKVLENEGFEVVLTRKLPIYVKYDNRTLIYREVFIFSDLGGNNIFFPESLILGRYELDNFSRVLSKNLNSKELYSKYVYEFLK